MARNDFSRKEVCGGMRERKPGKGAGFTLVEILLVLAIAAVLISLAVPLYSEYIEKAKVVRAISEIVSISKSITAYNLENNRYPESLDEVGWGALKDPWGAPYRYLNIATALSSHGPGTSPRMDRWVHPINSDYDLYSIGKDGQSQPPLTAHMSKDDVIRANDGAYVGLASKF